MVFAACDGAAPVRGSAVTPNPAVDSVEGHGGIAVTAPRAERSPAPGPVVAPAERAVEPTEFVMQDPQGVALPAKASAEDEYLRCYALKEEDPVHALPCFERVASLPDASGETRLKARAWVERLSP